MVFTDEYDIEYNRDIEPGKNYLDDYYYRLTRKCIRLYKLGQRCTEQSVSRPTNFPPTGSFDGVTPDGYAGGWAYDPNHPSQEIVVHVYIDGPAGSGGVLLGGILTTGLRSDVNSILGITGNHGFNYKIPDNYKDGKPHPVYIYAIDLDDTSGYSNSSLAGNPKVFSK